MKNVIGTVIGAAIDRKNGDSGVKGAFLGYLASGTLKKLGILAAIGAGVVGLVNRARR
jgi:hypothetical protein